MPIIEEFPEYLSRSKAFNEDTLKKVVEEGSFDKWLQAVALLGQRVVEDAFATGGFGKWKPSNMTDKQTKQTLVETQQLRNSISSEVV